MTLTTVKAAGKAKKGANPKRELAGAVSALATAPRERSHDVESTRESLMPVYILASRVDSHGRSSMLPGETPTLPAGNPAPRLPAHPGILRPDRGMHPSFTEGFRRPSMPGMPLTLLLLYLLITPASSPVESATLPRGHDYFRTDFEGQNPLHGWSGHGTLAPGHDGGHALAIERPAGATKGSTAVQRPLPVEQMRGYLVYFSVWIKAENVSAKPKPWNGIKFTAPIVGPRWQAIPRSSDRCGHVRLAARDLRRCACRTTRSRYRLC